MSAALKLDQPTYTQREISAERQNMVASVRWGWFRDIGYTPHWFQIAMHNSFARYRLSCAGRRGGKTEWAGREASAYMIAGPFRVWIVAPTYDLGWKEFRVLVESLEHPANPYRITELNKNKAAKYYHIALSNGAECDVISLDKPRKSAHGEEVDLLITSESALADMLGGEDGVWNKTLVGAMSTRHAEAIFPTTPQGEDDFLYPMFMKGLVPDSPFSKFRFNNGAEIDLIDYYKYDGAHDPDYFSLQWPAWANVEGYTEDANKQFQDLPLRIFLEQVCGFFVRWSGSIWLNDFCYDPLVHFIPRLGFVPEWWNRIEVIDPGYSGMFAWIAAVISDEGHIYQIDEYMEKRTLYKDHVVAINQHRAQFARSYGYSYAPDKFIPVYVDPEDPQCRAELNSLGLRCIQANNDVNAGFQAGGMRFKANTMHIFNTCTKTDRALRNHEWVKQKQDGAKAKEANDAWKHPSDLIRYLCLAPIWPSEKPIEVSDKETLADILGGVRKDTTNWLDMSMGDWRRLHG